jgi:hypothetical protein
LETLNGTPLNGLFHARRLRTFEPREGTKLALAEAARKEGTENDGELEEDDMVTAGVGNVSIDADWGEAP